MLRHIAKIFLLTILIAIPLVYTFFLSGVLDPAYENIAQSVVVCSSALGIYLILQPFLFSPDKKPITFQGILICALALFLLCSAGDTLATMMQSAGIDAGMDAYSSISGSYTIEEKLLRTCLFAPIAEEILFRGVIFGLLCRKMPVVWSALISSLLFAGAHMTAPHLVASTMFGIFACFAYLRFGRLWMCVAFHMANNIAAVFLPDGAGDIGLVIAGFIGLALALLWLGKAGEGERRQAQASYVSVSALLEGKIATFMERLDARIAEKTAQVEAVIGSDEEGDGAGAQEHSAPASASLGSGA